MIQAWPQKPNAEELEACTKVWKNHLVNGKTLPWPKQLSRRVCAWRAESKLSSAGAAGAVPWIDRIYPLAPSDEDLAGEFNPEDAYMWHVRCDSTELQLLAEIHDMTVSDEVSKTDLEVLRADAAETGKWATFITDAFACPTLLDAITGNAALVDSACAAFIRKDDATRVGLVAETTIESTEAALNEIRQFCFAWTTHRNSKPSTEDAHLACKKLFKSSCATNAEEPLSQFHSLLVTACRQRGDWQNIEQDCRESRSWEHQTQAMYWKFDEGDFTDDSVLDFMTVLPHWKKRCRQLPSVATDGLEQKAFTYIVQRVGNYCVGEVDDVKLHEQQSRLKALSQILSFRATDTRRTSIVSEAVHMANQALDGFGLHTALAALVDAATSSQDRGLHLPQLWNALDQISKGDLGDGSRSVDPNLEKLYFRIKPKLEADVVNFQSTEYQQLLTNWSKICDMWKIPPDQAGPVQVAELMSKCSDLCNAAAAARSSKRAKEKVDTLNQATRTWLTFRATETTADGSFVKRLLVGVKEPVIVKEALETWNAIAEDEITTATNTYKDILNECEQISGGLREKGSWKQGLTDSSSEDDIKAATRVLTSGPGNQVLQIKQVLEDVPCSYDPNKFNGFSRATDPPCLALARKTATCKFIE